LRSGIDVEGAGTSVVVKASSLDGGGEREYAAYNEYGTRYMGAQPFMLPGYQAAMGSSVPAAVAEYAAKIEGAA
jgi:HK97 gp10 family phage protein